ncbi:MAG: threonine ammonia-lyase, biosynthetic [Candidatus Dactylopiibacterium carminicum]|uniref:L-threonine dehydratase n=1 Tax=Candidatus Dactylopiibacterium carminicum TaxID=857335 RepID=A0A272EYJ8_9RHOO|nr:threonine ammonia-lyase, biosynthetic [Candidatus Dactylopiibacterium carminicum]KAF7600583.1 threonine ammonia-lyase, biosynthetic [Candidatus Dactylopiibacterium carminicum]PAS95181.1 MAG: threonine ammonia-lyase, biosynthetic [Candidatus Dactylopiibacterium carminicum]PAS97982.1 MAG: threonine ammonia-lyase, biosynthetic [Candidatus Dactylopiibacterium carminicum]PAT00588.1 MAG: PLP-dependent threonine dehydratase [Candidatus Dactylopiibacterium carminicum]
MPIDYLERILNAQVYDVAIETPLDPLPKLSQRLRANILLKREDLQPVFSFKLRGAANRMAQLSPAQLARGVICASAGNHAQGVALVAQRMNVRAVIVMPQTTPEIKVEAVRARGAEVVLAGESFDDAYARARELETSEGLVFIHPYDDPDVIAGQGTIGMEILRQHRGALDAVFCCVGGGGLIAGVAAYIKRLRPHTRVIGVEAVDAPTLTRALEANERVRLASVGLFADGAAVKQIGEETFRLARQYVDETILVDTDEICAAIKDVFEDTRAILEPAGALAVAGAKAWLAREGRPGAQVAAVASGANVNFDRLRFVAERAEVGEQREALLAVTIPERPGSFRQFCSLLGARSVTEFNYRYADPSEAHVFAGVAIRDRAESHALIAQLRAAGLPTQDLTDDEMAKDHLRYLVGGRAPQVDNELLYRFTFPERPGALARFLDHLHSDWNISLFHYRNHGADYGRVLVGMQVPRSDYAAFQHFLDRLGYEYSEETANPAYRLFLGLPA